MSEVHNLDDGVSEYFEFILFEKKYRFRHLTTHEFSELIKVEEDSKKDISPFLDFLARFITPVEEGTPAFTEVYPKMTLDRIKKFSAMVKQEFTT